MYVKTITDNKKQYIDLLLLADEQENMIDKYLERGILFAFFEDDIKGICVVTDEGNKIIEIKNIAVVSKYQRNGYGKFIINWLTQKFKYKYDIMRVGTGESNLTIPFYESCGFERYDVIKNFFIDYYDKPIFEDGKQLKDMIYLRKFL